jgi:hypothetical protein
MANETAPRGVEAKMDAASLYREEIYTDRAAGTIRVLTPVTRDGGPDQTRPSIYVGEAQILTNMGPLPIVSKSRRRRFGEAVQQYGEAARKASRTPSANCRKCADSSLVDTGAGPDARLPGPAAHGWRQDQDALSLRLGGARVVSSAVRAANRRS